ncbi:MAG TPA: hypothetical protein DCQ31_14800, partial [Bacteroidales bacterium]|nr:hypothetical protein [Bacteroidales bacterium]
LTDGFVDQNMKDRTRFGSQRMTALLNQILNLNLNDQVTKLTRVSEFLNSNSELQRDDITVVGLKLE